MEPLNTFPITKLPPDLILEISDWLRDIDTICLALTSKWFYSILRRTKAIRPLRYYSEFDTAEESCPLCSTFRFHEYRVLCRLEDSRWRPCKDCIRLHRVDQFSAGTSPLVKKLMELRLPSYRDIKDSITLWASRSCYMGPYSGRVRVCKHISLTYYEKLELLEQLRRGDIPPKTVSYRSPPWHECFEPIGKMSGFKIEYRPYICRIENGLDILVILADYRWVPTSFFEFSPDGAWEASVDPSNTILMCNHRSAILHWRDWVRARNGAQWRDKFRPSSTDDSLISCSLCYFRYTCVGELCSCGTEEGIHRCTQKGRFQCLMDLGHDQGLLGTKDHAWHFAVTPSMHYNGENSPAHSELCFELEEFDSPQSFLPNYPWTES